MNKKARVIHRILFCIGWLMLVWQLVFFLAHWSSLPDEAGIHFAPDGSFDVYASGVYGFYPHIISLIILSVDTAAAFVVGREKLKLGLKVSERGKEIIISSIVITLDIVANATTLILCFWTYAVSTQDDSFIMHEPPTIVLRFLLLVVLAAVFFQCIANARYKERPEQGENLTESEKRKRRLMFLLTGSSKNSDSGISHRLSRYVGWLIVVIITGICLFLLERLPINDLADEHHGKAWFENLGGYYDKWLVFLPVIIAVPFMAVCEAVSVRACRKGNDALMRLCDRMKLLLALFTGYWMLENIYEIAIGPVSLIVFAVLTAFIILCYVLEKRRK